GSPLHLSSAMAAIRSANLRDPPPRPSPCDLSHLALRHQWSSPPPSNSEGGRAQPAPCELAQPPDQAGAFRLLHDNWPSCRLAAPMAADPKWDVPGEHCGGFGDLLGPVRASSRRHPLSGHPSFSRIPALVPFPPPASLHSSRGHGGQRQFLAAPGG